MVFPRRRDWGEDGGGQGCSEPRRQRQGDIDLAGKRSLYAAVWNTFGAGPGWDWMAGRSPTHHNAGTCREAQPTYLAYFPNLHMQVMAQQGRPSSFLGHFINLQACMVADGHSRPICLSVSLSKAPSAPPTRRARPLLSLVDDSASFNPAHRGCASVGEARAWRRPNPEDHVWTVNGFSMTVAPFAPRLRCALVGCLLGIGSPASALTR
jgi:hypothetical protein